MRKVLEKSMYCLPVFMALRELSWLPLGEMGEQNFGGGSSVELCPYLSYEVKRASFCRVCSSLVKLELVSSPDAVESYGTYTQLFLN